MAVSPDRHGLEPGPGDLYLVLETRSNESRASKAKETKMNEQEINTALAEMVMEWTLNETTLLGNQVGLWCDNRGEFVIHESEWRPSTDEGQALQVAKRLVEYVNGADRFVISGGKDIYSCVFQRFVGLGTSTWGFSTDEPTMERAICVAALDALGIEMEDENE